MPQQSAIQPATALELQSLVSVSEGAITSRVLAKTTGGSVTLFGFDAGESLSEHTAPFDALVVVLDGAFALTVGGTGVEAQAGTIVRLPAGIAHAVEARTASRMLLIMLREPAART